MLFNLGNVTRNGLLNKAEKDAAYRQSEMEHEQALNKFVQPGMTPVQEMIAKEMGEEYEKSLPKYWLDQSPRRNVDPSSSFIEQVEHFPIMGITRVQMGGKSYIYPMDDNFTGDMLTSDSIGKVYNDSVKRK
jgi:hypothetical protein